MKNLNKIIYKTLIISILLVCMNYIYKYTFFEDDIQKYSSVLNLVRTVVNENAEIIYLGESSNITTRSDDMDKRYISEFLSEYFPSKKIGNITKEASHAGIYYQLLRNLPEKSAVKTVIVTLNLRSFNANWIYSNLETPLQKSMVLLKNYPPLYKRLMLSFSGYDIKTDKEREAQFKNKWEKETFKLSWKFPYRNVIEWDNYMANKGIKNKDGSINYPLTELACHYIKTYAFQIDTTNNPRITDFDNIIKLAKKRNWNLIFNLLAENIQMADSLVGKDLIFMMEENRKLLKNRYNKDNVKIVDNFNLIENGEFIDQNWTTEHYAEKGRKLIAKNLALSLKEFYPNSYKEVKYTDIKPYIFFNDCEGKTNWGQMQTICSTFSYKGNKSSQTGKGQVFSITYEYAIKNLPDSLKSLNINLYCYQKDNIKDLQLVLELYDNQSQSLRKNIYLNDLKLITNKWNNVNYNYNLPADFYKNKLIKVYIYNPSKTEVYIDDFKITFFKQLSKS